MSSASRGSTPDTNEKAGWNSRANSIRCVANVGSSKNSPTQNNRGRKREHSFFSDIVPHNQKVLIHSIAMDDPEMAKMLNAPRVKTTLYFQTQILLNPQEIQTMTGPMPRCCSVNRLVTASKCWCTPSPVRRIHVQLIFRVEDAHVIKLNFWWMFKHTYCI